MVKILSFQDIFEKDEKNRGYTKEALLYHDILKYPIKTNSQRFKFWDLARWLLENNKEFRDAFDKDLAYSSTKNTTITYAVQKKQDRIKAKIQDLIELGLLRIAATERALKVNTEVNLYSHTGEGYLIAWLLEREYPKKRDESNEMLFAIIQSALKRSTSSQLLFASMLYAAYKENGLFDYIMGVFKENLCKNVKLPIEFDVYHAADAVFNAIISSVKKKQPEKQLFMEIFFQTLNGLDEDTRKNLYFILKSEYDARTLRYYPSKEWEDLWIKSLDDNSKVVTIVSCFVCQQEYPTLIDITETLTPFPRGFRDTICEKCNKNANATLFTEHPKQLLKMTVTNKEELFGSR